MDKKVVMLIIAIVIVVIAGGAIYFITRGKASSNNVSISEDTKSKIESSRNSESADITSNNVNNENNTVTEQQSGSKVLVTYYSWGGTTEKVAKEIANKTGADIEEIEPTTPYTTNYDKCTEVALDEKNNNARPAINDLKSNLDDYDVVFIGYPIWWMDAPMLIYTLLDKYDFAGKVVIPFTTSYSSGESGTFNKIKNKLSKADVVTSGLHIFDRDMDNYVETTDNWLNKLGY